MSQVVKSRRKKHEDKPFVAEKNLWDLRDDITDLMLLEFGYDERKYDQLIEWYQKNHASASNVDEVVERYRRKNEAYKKRFIDHEFDKVSELMEHIQTEFSIANSIHPAPDSAATIMEYCERRLHMDLAIGYCFALKNEIQYIIRKLPVNINKFTPFGERIDKQIALFRGVRQADNRFLKKKKQN